MPPAFFDAIDSLGRRVTLPEQPRRIVSLVPSITELLADLDLEERVVGVTRFCELPDGWREAKTIVGGTKDVKADVVADLQADFVLANQEENEKTDVETLANGLGVPVYVTEVRTVPDATDMIRTVGYLTATAEAANEMADAIDERFDALPRMEPVRAVYLIWREPYMTVGGDTFIHDVMTRGGFKGVFSGDTRYPEITIDEIVAKAPDVVLCSSEPFPFHQKERFTADLRAALPESDIRVVDGQLFSWYGPRLLHTPEYLTSLHGELRRSEVQTST